MLNKAHHLTTVGCYPLKEVHTDGKQPGQTSLTELVLTACWTCSNMAADTIHTYLPSVDKHYYAHVQIFTSQPYSAASN